MLNHCAFAQPDPAPKEQHDLDSASAESEILTLARNAGMLITLDGQIGREKYQSISGSVSSFRRFAEALRKTPALLNY
jgi:hypothetical protein